MDYLVNIALPWWSTKFYRYWKIEDMDGDGDKDIMVMMHMVCISSKVYLNNE